MRPSIVRWELEAAKHRARDGFLYRTQISLDNHFIAGHVVTTMRAAKKKRQFLFSSHNPNIPVLGDADQIIGLTHPILADKNLIVIPRSDDTTFGILHSRFHEVWSLRKGSDLQDRPRYTHTSTFATFPFPKKFAPNLPPAKYVSDAHAKAIAAAAAKLNELRENWLNPAKLIDLAPEVVPGFPDRILPKDEAAAKELKKRTLTNLYNARPAWLDHAHRALDEAVAEAYGWGDDWRAGILTHDEILTRLFKLNQERAAKQAK